MSMGGGEGKGAATAAAADVVEDVANVDVVDVDESDGEEGIGLAFFFPPVPPVPTRGVAEDDARGLSRVVGRACAAGGSIGKAKRENERGRKRLSASLRKFFVSRF